jgi:UDP-glucose 4-epimerase
MPQDPYAISKYEAEVGLLSMARESGLEVVIIRPPLVYGPGAKANFLSMMCWLHKGVPLPLGGIRNARSLVALDNLVDLIVTCMSHPAAVNRTFMVSDGEDLSTPELLRRTAKAMGRQARLFHVPGPLLHLAASILGKGDVAQRLLGSLQADISSARQALGWIPPVSVDQVLRETVEHFLAHRS